MRSFRLQLRIGHSPSFDKLVANPTGLNIRIIETRPSGNRTILKVQGMPTLAAITDQAITLAMDRFFQQPEIRGNLEFLSHRLPGSAEIFIVE